MTAGRSSSERDLQQKEGRVIMALWLTKPKHSHEQCMSSSHSQVWRGFNGEDGRVCKQGTNAKKLHEDVFYFPPSQAHIRGTLFLQQSHWLVSNGFAGMTASPWIFLLVC